MDWLTVVTSVTSALGVTLGGAYWLMQRAIDNRLNKDLARYKAGLDKELVDAKGALDADLVEKKAALDEKASQGKALLDAALRRDVETYLGDKAAERQYRLDAQKRLYSAIGPLRFQLIIAAAEFANRVSNIGAGTQNYNLNIAGYFGRSTAFRLLRLFSIAELIERQIAHADFSVDPGTVFLLRFKTTAFRCLSSSAVSLGHPNEDWNNQTEHVFYDTLSTIASAMIVTEQTGQRAMRFDEFSTFLGDANNERRLSPIPRLLDGFKPASKPLLWLRFVALADICTSFAAREGEAIGLLPEPLNSRALLQSAGDKHINVNVEKYVAAFEALRQHITPTSAPKAAG